MISRSACPAAQIAWTWAATKSSSSARCIVGSSAGVRPAYRSSTNTGSRPGRPGRAEAAPPRSCRPGSGSWLSTTTSWPCRDSVRASARVYSLEPVPLSRYPCQRMIRTPQRYPVRPRPGPRPWNHRRMPPRYGSPTGHSRGASGNRSDPGEARMFTGTPCGLPRHGAGYQRPCTHPTSGACRAEPPRTIEGRGRDRAGRRDPGPQRMREPVLRRGDPSRPGRHPGQPPRGEPRSRSRPAERRRRHRPGCLATRPADRGQRNGRHDQRGHRDLGRRPGRGWHAQRRPAALGQLGHPVARHDLRRARDDDRLRRHGPRDQLCLDLDPGVRRAVPGPDLPARRGHRRCGNADPGHLHRPGGAGPPSARCRRP